MKRILLLFLIIPFHLYAQDKPVNEDDLFSGQDNIVENKSGDNTVNEMVEKRSLGVSGKINSALLYSKIDESMQNSLSEKKSFIPYIIGDLFLDARMPGGYKGFGSFELKHDASVDEEETGDKKTTYSMKELFVDFNFNRRIYFRTGKQVLQWGRCYLWNPTDMMNIEHKSYVSKLEGREGTYGVKGHIPFGTAVNIYGFADLNGTEEGEDIAGAGKFEFLIKDTEMAFSVWGKKKFSPVYGYDFSARILGIDIKGEAAYSHGSNTQKAVNENGTLYILRDKEKDVYKACINFGRDFDFGEKANMMNISIELFYNGDGYDENPSEDENTYLYSEPVVIKRNTVTCTIPGGSMRTFILGHGLYEPNYLSKYYAALFITIKEFITSDFTFTFNTISNIKQKSYILSPGIIYTNINNFTAGAAVNGYLGNEEGEYRASGLKYDILVNAGILF